MTLYSFARHYRMHDKGTVTMASGVNMHELMDFFINHNLCFESNVILRDVTIAGIVSTGCHGVGGDQLCVSDWITEIALVDSKGRLREFKQGVNTADEMKAVQVSLGMFGILVSITMKVQTQFLVRTDNLFPRVLDYFFNPGALKEFVNSNWSVEMFWFPFSGMELVHLDQFEAIITGRVGDYSWNPMNDNLWVRAINRYKKTDLHLPPITKEYHMKDDSANDLADGSLQMVEKLLHPLNKTTAGRVIDKLIHKHIDPIFMYASFKGIQAQYGPVVGVCQPITNAIHYRTFKNMVPVYDMSFAFHCPNTEKGFHTICQAITKVIEMVQHSAIEGRYPLSTIMEMRWISHSDTLLSPAIVGKPKQAGPKGYTFYLEILSYEGTENATKFFEQVADYWMSIECDGVKPLPHWGKQWDMIPGMRQHIREGYKENMAKFKEIRTKLQVDEENMFTNGVLTDIFEL